MPEWNVEQRLTLMLRVQIPRGHVAVDFLSLYYIKSKQRATLAIVKSEFRGDGGGREMRGWKRKKEEGEKKGEKGRVGGRKREDDERKRTKRKGVARMD